jgi:hypothetical protein
MKRVPLKCFLPLKLPKKLWFLGCFIGLLCHHPILGDSPKFIFFPKIKNKKIK